MVVAASAAGIVWPQHASCGRGIVVVFRKAFGILGLIDFRNPRVYVVDAGDGVDQIVMGGERVPQELVHEDARQIVNNLVLVEAFDWLDDAVTLRSNGAVGLPRRETN